MPAGRAPWCWVLFASAALPLALRIASSTWRAPTWQSAVTEHSKLLLITSHPDDESMFFSPALLHLAIHPRSEVHLLCLSTGNIYGLGSLRVEELMAASAVLQIPAERIKVMDDPELQDGMATSWSPGAVQRQVHAAVQAWGINQLLTFDAGGVSGHINHDGVHQGVRQYLRWRQKQMQAGAQEELQAWQLESVSLLRKYSGMLDIPVSALTGQGLVVLNPRPWLSLWAMAQHRSQLEWYRWLFMFCSRYIWVNTLLPLPPAEDPPELESEHVYRSAMWAKETAM